MQPPDETIRLNNVVYNLQNTNWLQLIEQTNTNSNFYFIYLFLHNWANNHITIELKTSGSTGQPKKIIAQKKHLLASAKKTANFFKLNQSSKALLCLPANYIAGQMMLVRAMVTGMELTCIEPCNNPLENNSKIYDFAAMVPYQVNNIISSGQKLSMIKNLIIGGGQISHVLENELINQNTNIFESFGMTETYSHIALRQICTKQSDSFFVLDNVFISTTADNCLTITSTDIGVNNLVTNDIVDICKPGSFIWKGRTDFVINSGGIKINPETIERLIAGVVPHPFCISWVNDNELGQKLVLVVENETINKQNIHYKIGQLLKKYERPKQILVVDKIPLTNTGKINRLKTRELIE